MSKAKHTPGPWRLGPKAGVNQHVVGPRQYGRGKTYTTPPGNVIAYVPIGSPGEDEGNARLIAAAPELADALAIFLEARESGSENRLKLATVAANDALRKAGRLP